MVSIASYVAKAIETGQKALGSRPLRDLLLPECSTDYAAELSRWEKSKRGAGQALFQRVEN